MSRASVRIRPAEHADIDEVVALIAAVDTRSGLFSGRGLINADRGHVSARLGEILDEQIRTLLVAVEEGTGDIVGLLVARDDEIGAIDLTTALHVTHLLVAPGHRRRGVGRALLAAAVHLADERGLERILASAASGSREANRYLARLGFAPLVVHRVASTSALRRALGIGDASDRMVVLRRARLVRAQRSGTSLRASRVIDRGA